MRLRQIEVFHAVYSTGSMTAAAALLHVSQPSVSKVLAHAEQQLGYALFERSKGKLTPTPEAHRLFGHVAIVYRDMDRLRRIARNLSASDVGNVRIATTPAFGVDLLPRAVASYQAEHAQTFFEIETLHAEEITSALLEARVDIGLAFGSASIPGIATERLASAKFVVLTGPDVAIDQQNGVTITDLADLPFISLNGRGPLGRLLEDYISASGTALNVVSTCETYQVAKALVACGAGVTIVDEITARSSGHEDVGCWPLTPALNFDIVAQHFENVPLSVVARRFVEHLTHCILEFLPPHT